MVKLASEILSQRKNLETSFASDRRKNALNDILRVGTSAGGARAKVVIAWNPDTNEVRAAVARWPDYAEQAQVASGQRKQIQLNHRLKFPGTG